MVKRVLMISNMYPGEENRSFGSFIKVHVDTFRRYTDLEQFVVVNTDQRKGLPRLIYKYGSLLLRSIWCSLRRKFDVIHAHYVFPTGFIGLICHWLTGRPLVITAHGSDVYNLASKNKRVFRVSRFVLRRASAVIAVSRDIRDELVDEFGVDEEKIHIINMGVDTSIFRPMDKEECRRRLGLPLDKRIVLFVGNIIPRKGVLYLIESLEHVKFDDVQCIILGAPVDREYFDTVKNRLNEIDADVRFFDAVPYSEVAVWMNAADVFVLPSNEEAFGLVALEALACGTPTIATAVGGLKEFIRDSETGYSVPIGDALAIADKINHVLDPENRAEVESIREKGLQVADSFSTVKQVKRILRVYRDVA
ncbi:MULTISPECIES: glycosyltransferase family 4 protein [unclassified Methanothermobacter]|uniref:glycosyltransferase family 4 protein n=1 Tax=unclassified Methanothermobacter TaxID=2631116 RepID=UPI0002CD0F07|nr:MULTISPECIES: glycosyltransferase family 4 protein [unclassified Methanothermobacter]BAM69638.1 glycosyltransferase [Methanothermobacter sp. CaT2]BAZ98490.1 D-inositol 3-phosphate glycosyltransferase [Methanothermobacter sp. EMTCatA1]